MKTIEEINQSKVKKIISERKHPEFFPGDIVKVGVRITEGKRDRIQYFEGVCIAKKNRDINSSFTVRKISFGEGVERTFALYSPIVDTIKVVRSGKVRRAKLYYLRDRTGKSARIAEKIKKKIGIDVETKIHEVTEENVMPDTEQKTADILQDNNKDAPKVEAKKPEDKKETKEETPSVEKKTDEKKEKILSQDLSREILPILRTFVSTKDGTASLANVNGYEIGGKTGTAEKSADGKYSNKKINSFVSVFPTSKPKFVLAVMLDEPKINENYIYHYRDGSNIKYKGTPFNTAGWTTVEATGQIVEKIGPILATKYSEFNF